MDRLAAAYSVRGLASALLTRYPEAATLTIRENLDGENQYDILNLKDADGGILEHTDDDDAWVYEEAENGTDMQEFAYDFDLKSDPWAEGVATVRTDRHDGKVAVIDLRAGLKAPIPRFDKEADPSTRALTENEQRILVDAAYEGLYELNDKLGKERSVDYDEADLEGIREQVAATRKVLNPIAGF